MEKIKLSQYDRAAAIGKRARILQDTSSPSTLSSIEMHELRQRILISRGEDPQQEVKLLNGAVVRKIDMMVLHPEQIAEEEFRMGKMPISILKGDQYVDVNVMVRD